MPEDYVNISHTDDPTPYKSPFATPMKADISTGLLQQQCHADTMRVNDSIVKKLSFDKKA